MSFSLSKFFRFGGKGGYAVLALHDDFIQVAQFDAKGNLLVFNETALEKGIIEEGAIKQRDALKSALPPTLKANRLICNVPSPLLYPFVRDASGNISDDTLKTEMAGYIRGNCPVSPDELSFVYEKRQSSFGAIGMPRDFKGTIEKIAADSGISSVELVPEPYARLAVLTEAPAGDFALFCPQGEKVSISLFHNGLLYDSFSGDEAIKEFHEAFEEARRDFQTHFNRPLNAFYFLGFPKALQAKARQVFSDSKDKLIFEDGEKSPLYGAFDAKYDRMTLVGLQVYTERGKNKE